METITRKSLMPRAARLLLAIVLSMSMPAASWAEEFVTDVRLIGGETYAEVQAKINEYRLDGWKLVDYDLNKGCGKNSDYIYLLYKTAHYNDRSNHHYITKLKLVEGSRYPEHYTDGEYIMYLVPYAGSSHFVEMKGDLNSNAGGKYIHLYYSKTDIDDKAITDIWADSNSSDAMWITYGHGYDLNAGAGGDYIYMHYNRGDYREFDTGIDYDLSTVDCKIELGNMDMIYGKVTNPNARVYILPGTSVWFMNVEIDTSDGSWGPGIYCMGDARIFFNGVNRIHGRGRAPGIYAIYGHSLQIDGDGTLMAYGATNQSGSEGGGPGIGGYSDCGDIYINSGEVIAVGGKGAAGIGGMQGKFCGNIYIDNNITRVVATAGEDAPNAIGAGKDGTGGEVTYGNMLDVLKEGSTWTVTPIDPDGIKEIKNEELKMKNEGAIYNLAGQRLSKMQKGINIVGGKKILK